MACPGSRPSVEETEESPELLVNAWATGPYFLSEEGLGSYTPIIEGVLCAGDGMEPGKAEDRMQGKHMVHAPGPCVFLLDTAEGP